MKLDTAHDLAAEAIDLKIATDAPSRNALNKLYAALEKVMGDNRRSGEGVTNLQTNQTPVEGLTVTEKEGVDGEQAEETMVQNGREEAATGVGESLLEELLDDEGEEEL